MSPRRQTRAGRWEEAVSALDRPASTTTPPTATTPASREQRWWLGYCLRCEAEMWTTGPRPRVPICCGPIRRQRRRPARRTDPDE